MWINKRKTIILVSIPKANRSGWLDSHPFKVTSLILLVTIFLLTVHRIYQEGPRQGQAGWDEGADSKDWLVKGYEGYSQPKTPCLNRGGKSKTLSPSSLPQLGLTMGQKSQTMRISREKHH